MANTQINVTTNGTTTLATAGKYCDRNINVNVNVPGGGIQPTQFTNHYRPEWVTIDKHTGYSSADGYVISNDSEANYIRIPYTHMAGEAVVLRMRGISTVRSRFGFILWAADGGTPVFWGQISADKYVKTIDEYGDMSINLNADSSILNKEWHYIEFNFQYTGYSSATEALIGPIITINEPIGNGGAIS